MKTILFVHASDELYGSDRCLLALVKGLPETHRAIVVLPDDIPHLGPLTRRLQSAGATVHHRRMLVLRRANLTPGGIPGAITAWVAGIWMLARIIRAERVTLVHSNTVAVICGAFAAALTRRPHLWHVHEFLGDEPLHIRLPLRLLLLCLPGAIVANSRATARSTGIRRTRVVENSVFTHVHDDSPATSSRTELSSRPKWRDLVPDQAWVEPRSLHFDRDDNTGGRDDNTGGRNDKSGDHTDNVEPVTIGVVGRLSERKGISQALEAAAILKRAGHDFHLLFAGGPPPGQPQLRDRYERHAAQLGLTDNTTFLGEVADPSEIYASVDILLVPSQRPEPFGLTIIEGMAAGCSLVVTRNGGGSDEILEHGVSGLYCDRNPESIAAALEQLIVDPGLRHNLAASAREVANSRYAPGRYLADIRKTWADLGA